MSDHWIGIIPRDPFFVPSDEAIEKAASYMDEVAPESEEIESKVTEAVYFRDCGENLETIRCPVCEAELSVAWWSEQMGDEDCWDEEYKLHPISLPWTHGEIAERSPLPF